MTQFERALVAFAHPDDAEFTCGGTIASWTKAGTEVVYVCATDGAAGWNGPDRAPAEIAEIRADELQAAAAVLGVASVGFLGFPDGSLEPNLDLRRALSREVRRTRPDVVIAPDPSHLWSRDRGYINHPDHRAVGEAMLAVVACDAPTRPQFPELLDEGFEPYSIPALWMPCWAKDADTHVDVSETLDLKLEAIRCHRSQLENMAEFDAETAVREWAERFGRDGGIPLAEAFRTFRMDGS